MSNKRCHWTKALELTAPTDESTWVMAGSHTVHCMVVAWVQMLMGTPLNVPVYSKESFVLFCFEGKNTGFKQ